jgi:hypothetical protein
MCESRTGTLLATNQQREIGKAQGEPARIVI